MKIKMILATLFLMVCFATPGLANEIDTTASISFLGENPYKPPVPEIPPKGDGGDGTGGTDGDKGGSDVQGKPNNGHTGNGSIIGTLRQTNDTRGTFLLVLGILLIALAISVNHILFNRKGRETI